MTIAKHRVWAGRDKPEAGDELTCETCECTGNEECGHKPLGAPYYGCEISPSGDCYCCVLLSKRDWQEPDTPGKCPTC